MNFNKLAKVPATSALVASATMAAGITVILVGGRCRQGARTGCHQLHRQRGLSGRRRRRSVFRPAWPEERVVREHPAGCHQYRSALSGRVGCHDRGRCQVHPAAVADNLVR